jgi:hypothetical protein
MSRYITFKCASLGATPEPASLGIEPAGLRVLRLLPSNSLLIFDECARVDLHAWLTTQAPYPGSNTAVRTKVREICYGHAVDDRAYRQLIALVDRLTSAPQSVHVMSVISHNPRTEEPKQPQLFATLAAARVAAAAQINAWRQQLSREDEVREATAKDWDEVLALLQDSDPVNIDIEEEVVRS